LTPLPDPDPTGLVAHQQRLLDVYGALLTDHQREACRLHLDEDWSYAELAEHFGCSRSAAHDLVRRALVQLEHYERRLGHAAELARRDAVEDGLRRRLRLQGERWHSPLQANAGVGEAPHGALLSVRKDEKPA
jgi:predicted DNA-binding protein YlxM (UPF0122 family)